MSLEEFKAREFEAMTNKLDKALELLRGSSTIPATQASVMDLAGCSRRLLSTPERRWVMKELADIKKNRLSEDTPLSEGDAAEPTIDVDSLVKLIDQQNSRIETLQTQNSELFEEVLRLEGEKQTLDKESAELKKSLTETGCRTSG
jgi:hypothetical protein